jgi:hypothetical protein
MKIQLFVFLINNNNNDKTITHNAYKTNKQANKQCSICAVSHISQPLQVFTATSMSVITSKFTTDEKSPTKLDV